MSAAFVALFFAGVFEICSSDTLLSSIGSEAPQEQVSVRLMYGESHGISWTDLNIHDRLPPLLFHMYINVLSIDYHYRRRCLFYSAWENMWSIPIEEGGCKDIPRLVVEGGVTNLAVDWVNDRIYWTQQENSLLWSTDLTGKNRSLILKHSSNISSHHNIVIDPYVGFIFLAADRGHFFRSDLNGESLQRVGVEGRPNIQVVSLALETSRRRLYLSVRWDHLPAILSCEYDGSRVQDYVLTDDWWNSLVSIGALGNQLFWAHQDWEGQGHDTVWKADVITGGSFHWFKEYTAPGTVIDPTTKIWTMKVYHPNVQSPMKEARTQVPVEGLNRSSCQGSSKVLLAVIAVYIWTALKHDNVYYTMWLS